MPYKPVDTAIKVIVGPLIDDTDFKSREEAVAYNAAGMEIDIVVEKSDGTITTTAVTPTTAGDYDWAHTDQGYYELELPASGGASFNNTEEGILRVVGYATGVLPFGSVAYDVVPTQVYNSLVPGSDKLQVDAVEFSSSTTAANNAEVVFDTDFATNYDTTNNFWVTLLANDANHGGASFLLTGDRLAFTSTSGTCASFTGEGSGRGLEVTGGATGAGCWMRSGATSGDGLLVQAVANGHGFKCQGASASHGIYAIGGSGTGDGFNIAGGTSNGKGLTVTSYGTGNAMVLTAAGTGTELADASGNYIGVDIQAISADQTAAVNCESAFDGTGYNVGNGNIVAASVTGNVGGSVNSLNTQAKADVNAEVKDVLDTDTYTERAIAAGPPAANAPLSDKIVWLAMLARNKLTSDGSTQTLFDDAGTGTVSTASISDAAGTTTRGEWS